MKLDEAIKRFEEIAEEAQKIVDTHYFSNTVSIDEIYCDDTEIIEEKLAGYQKCADEYGQFAEWLKDYKRLLEQEPTTKNNLSVDCIDRAQAQTEIQMNARRYSIAKEFGGAGQVEWSDYLISIKDALGILRNLLSVTPVSCIAEISFSKEDMQEIVEEKIKDIVVERKKGKWIIDEDEYNRIWNCHCSECKKDPQDYIAGTENWWLVQLPNYCPNCGLEMEIEE